MARQFRHYIHHTFTSHPTLHLCLLYTTEKNGNTTTDYESNYNHIVVIPQAWIRKNNLPPKKQPHLGGGFKNLLFSSLPSIWGNDSISLIRWVVQPPTSHYIYRVFFSPKIGAFRRSWLPKPMPGSARASCAAVLATRPGSWMPCNDTSNGTALVFEGIIKWDPKLGVGGSNLMQIYRDLLRISLIVIVNCLGR